MPRPILAMDSLLQICIELVIIIIGVVDKKIEDDERAEVESEAEVEVWLEVEEGEREVTFKDLAVTSSSHRLWETIIFSSSEVKNLTIS